MREEEIRGLKLTNMTRKGTSHTINTDRGWVIEECAYRKNKRYLRSERGMRIEYDIDIEEQVGTMEAVVREQSQARLATCEEVRFSARKAYEGLLISVKPQEIESYLQEKKKGLRLASLGELLAWVDHQDKQGHGAISTFDEHFIYSIDYELTVEVRDEEYGYDRSYDFLVVQAE